MSNPITRSKPAAAAVRAMPTIPPAGPDRIESLPRKLAASVSPPLDCMNSNRTPAFSVGGDQPPLSVGGDQPPPSVGGDQPPPSVGGDQPPPSVGGDQPPPSVGGDQPDNSAATAST